MRDRILPLVMAAILASCSQDVTLGDLGQGDCFEKDGALALGAPVRVVGCDEAHTYQVMGKGTMFEDDPLDRESRAAIVCQSILFAASGATRAPSGSSVEAVYDMSAQSRRSREVVCVTVNPR